MKKFNCEKTDFKPSGCLFNRLRKNRKIAFTLAEVLITLGIIGVVAALTVPVLVQKYNEKATVAKLKKIYSVLSQAFTRAVAENGQPETWGVRVPYSTNENGSIDSEASGKLGIEKAILLTNIMIPYLKTAKVCYTESGCWYDDKVYAMNGKQYDGYTGERPNLSKVLLYGGTMIGFGIQFSSESAKNIGWVLVDVNGSKKPNKYGNDIFEFAIFNKGVQPYGFREDNLYTFEKDCTKTSEGHGCTSWVIFNENMDYLHCDGLSWNGKHKCK